MHKHYSKHVHNSHMQWHNVPMLYVFCTESYEYATIAWCTVFGGIQDRLLIGHTKLIFCSMGDPSKGVHHENLG